MNYLFQFSILLFFWLLGEGVSLILSQFILIPGSIMGMILLFIALNLGIIKEDQIKDTSDFLLKNIAFFFLPASIGVMAYFTSDLISLVSIAVISTIITMTVTMLITQLLTKGES